MTESLHLADELLLHVLDHLLTDSPTLLSFSRCSRHLCNLAEPYLYSHIFVRSKKSLWGVLDAVTTRKERAAWIQTIEARFEYRASRPDRSRDNPFDRYGFSALLDLIRRAQNVIELTVESPYCTHRDLCEAELNDYDVFHSGLFDLLAREAIPQPGDTSPEGSLPRRQYAPSLCKLELHLSGTSALDMHTRSNEGRPTRYWNINSVIHASLPDSSSIFSHPTLTELVISCAELCPDAVMDRRASAARRPRRRAVTPLKRLTLIGCSISIWALEDMLAWPRALEYLHLGETCHHDDQNSWSNLFAEFPDFVLSALAQQQDSLQELIYVTKGLGPWYEETSDEWVSHSYETPSYEERLLLDPPSSSSSAQKGFAAFTALHTLTLSTRMQCHAFEEALWGAPVTPNTEPPALRRLRIIRPVDISGTTAHGTAWTCGASGAGSPRFRGGVRQCNRSEGRTEGGGYGGGG